MLLQNAAVPQRPVVGMVGVAQLRCTQSLAVGGANAWHMGKRPLVAELTPEVPVFHDWQCFIKAGVHGQHGTASEQNGMDGQVVDAPQALALPGQVVVTHPLAARALHPHPAVGSRSMPLLLQSLHQVLQVHRPQQIVVVQKQAQCTLHGLQAQIGGGGAAQGLPLWFAVLRHFFLRQRLPDDAQCQPFAWMGRLWVRTTAGVDHHHFNVGIGLQRHAGNGVCQRRPAHAAHDDADQGQLLRRAGQLQGVALQGPAAQCGGQLVFCQCLGRQLPIGFSGMHIGPADKGAHSRHGLCMVAVGMKRFLRGKGFQSLPLEVGYCADIHQRVGLGGRPHFIKKQRNAAMALCSSHACQGQCLVVGVGLGQGRQQKPARLVCTKRLHNALDQRRCMAQLAVPQIPAVGRKQPHGACCCP